MHVLAFQEFAPLCSSVGQSLKSGMSLQSTNEWPADGLEYVPSCPVCSSTDRREEVSGLEDRSYGCAPGKWTLHRCIGCGCAYLDPRPNRASIGLAYARYFTHGATPRKARNPLVAWLRQGLANSYRNRLFGTRLKPAIPAGWAISSLARTQARSLRLDGRGLDLAIGSKGKLLDIGCGNGEFLVFAKAAGWDCFGIEPDAVAAALAIEQGGSVIGSHLEEIDSAYDGFFDVITLSHVIEHVHDPVDFSRRCRRLLKQGGFLSIETPNIDSIGYEMYSRSWRGLEPPRHLVLFNRRSLTQCLSHSGFDDVRIMEPRDAIGYTFVESALIAGGRISESAPAPLSRSEIAAMRSNIRAARKVVRIRADKSEFINAIAFKSGNS